MGKKRGASFRKRLGDARSVSAAAKVPVRNRPIKSIREARTVTSAFHKLIEERQALRTRLGMGNETRYESASDTDPDSDSDDACSESGCGETEAAQRLRRVNRLLASMGGRKRYQAASMFATGLNKGTSKWVFSEVTRLGKRPVKGMPPLHVLEVGAINTQLLSCPFLDVRAIDIHSQHPKIERLDFFSLSLPLETKSYDCIVNGMVLNCVPDARLRGRMIVRCTRLLKEDGLFFVVLPSRCLNASKYIDEGIFLGACKRLGLELVGKRHTDKVCYFTLRKVPVSGSEEEILGNLAQKFPHPSLVKFRGKKRTNEFCVSFVPYDEQGH